MLKEEDQPPSEISVLLTTSDGIRELNRKFRGLNKPTDVLSFPAGDGPEEIDQDLLGDVAICLPIAEEQAKIHKVPLVTELTCLAVHGALHLLGYDDKASKDRSIMIDKMNEIVSSIGMKPAREWGSHYKH